MQTLSHPIHDPNAEVLAYMEEQSSQFELFRSQLLQTHLGQYIWFENGVVRDADLDFAGLFARISHHSQPQFIRRVLGHEPELMVRSSRLGQ
jgi:hypothetical protein